MMTRKEFIRLSALFGIGLQAPSILTSCKKSDDDPTITPFSGKALVIGAGAAGMASAYFLNQAGIDFEVLEANDTYGGRFRTNTSFTNFPIPLGAEWLHVGTDIFKEIVNNDSVNVNVNTVGYSASDIGRVISPNGNDVSGPIGSFIDRKFLNGSWYNFFEDYILPSVANKITYNAQVISINYSGNQVEVNTPTNQYFADKVIVTVPVKILQSGSINFTPPLPSNKQNALNELRVWDGFKAFFEFSSKFYPVFTEFEISPERDGQKLFYDAAYGQNTNKHILGLFCVGNPTQPYTSRSGDDLRDHILAELDGLFNNQATPNYVKHITQDWTKEPYAQAAYLTDQESWTRIRTLGETINDKVYFAGDGYTDGSDWSSVHAASIAAKETVAELVVG